MVIKRDMSWNQTDGVAMGIPLGPLLENIFMANLQRAKLKRLVKLCITRGLLIKPSSYVTTCKKSAETFQWLFLSKTTCFLTQSKIYRYSFHVNNICVYKLVCIFQSKYIGRTEGRAYIQKV